MSVEQKRFTERRENKIKRVHLCFWTADYSICGVWIPKEEFVYMLLYFEVSNMALVPGCVRSNDVSLLIIHRSL